MRVFMSAISAVSMLIMGIVGLGTTDKDRMLDVIDKLNEA